MCRRPAKGKAPNWCFPFTARCFAAILPSFLSVRGCTSPLNWSQFTSVYARLLAFMRAYWRLLAGPEPLARRKSALSEAKGPAQGDPRGASSARPR